MHYYSIDSSARYVGYFMLGIVAAALAPTVSTLLEFLGCATLVPSAFAIFVTALHLVDFLYAHVPGFHRLTMVTSLTGTWTGELVRTVNGAEERHRVTLRVYQTWRRIGITLLGERSKSEANLVHLSTSNPRAVSLKWVYDSKPTAVMPSGTNSFGEGVTDLLLSITDGRRTLTGSYYSSKLRSGGLKLHEVRPTHGSTPGGAA